ncbi:YqaJ viral recombinase family protein [Comamonas sp. Z1]|uniref:YqaJ viral recombinase family nuclease n=1 Tax=Comamonas TaxID=283 RepID=UPI0006B983FC|nr:MULTISPECIES: YqaJ viral recombinase family protein [Comamonas]TYK71035.1 YqaJ viral recombinase family protein [Comamonas sp. Z1]TYK73367.1 YqaJ viral recombinase family protein [Comamonas sp. Z3]
MSVHVLKNGNLDGAAGARTPRKGAALRLVSTKAMEREDWLEIRRTGIGSSDAAAAIGLNPYQSQLELWMQKTGKGNLLPTIDPNDDTSPMFWGTMLEPIVAAHYTKRTGNKVRRVNAVLQHSEHPWMLANVDREVVGSSEVQILECKTAGIHGARLWRDGVPEYVQLQVMHQLAVTGHRAADVAVLIGGQELRIFRIERDEVLIARLITLETRFWDMVQQGVAPAGDGSDSSDTALRCLFPSGAGDQVDLSDDEALNTTFEELLRARTDLDAVQKLEARLRQRIQMHMGEASKALFASGGSVTWKRSKDGQTFNTSEFVQAHPTLAQRFMSPKPGSRRFCVYEPEQ